MARALLKAGSIWDTDEADNSSISSAKEALVIVGQSQSTGAGGGTMTVDKARSMEKISNQSITDATLGLSNVKRYRDAAESAKTMETNRGVSVAADRRNNVQLLMFINSALSISLGNMELHEHKVTMVNSSAQSMAKLYQQRDRRASTTMGVGR